MNFTESELDTFHAVYERDVDLALVLALRASSAVRGVFARAVGCAGSELVSLRSSATNEDGREADLEIVFARGPVPVLVEIENKLDAPFGDGQVDAYVARVAARRGRDGEGTAHAVLFAPQRYLETSRSDAARFDATVSYEIVRDTVVSESDWGRGIALLIQHAIEQHRRGGKSSPDDPACTDFFARFSTAAEERGLPTLPRKGRKRSAGFLWFPRDTALTQIRGWRPRNASQGTYLGAKFQLGRASVDVSGGRPVVDFEGLERALDAEPVEVECDALSIRLSLRAPTLDPLSPYDDQVAAVLEFVNKLETLRRWWETRGRAIVENHVLRT